VGGIPLMVALDDGRISPGDLAVQYIPRWKSDPRKSRITIRHLATHTSGIENAEQDGLPHMQIPGWKGDFWRRKPVDPISTSLDLAPAIFEPGTAWHYSNTGMAALGYAVTAALRGAPEPDLRTVLAKRICGPAGIPDSEWSISYGESYPLDGMRVFGNWGGGAFTPRATARLGQLMLQKGVWNGRRLLSPKVVEQAVAYAGMPKPDRREDPAPASGLCWYTNYDGVWGRIPRDAFAGAGAQHQVLLVVPSLDLVVVRNGAALEPGTRFWGAALQYIFEPAVAAVSRETAAPYPPSPVIREVAFDPPDTILRQAAGSDNWPLTWADDGDLYTSYGDGWGFEPLLKQKLSLGLARISGMAPAIRAVNIRSESGERTGDGARGAKASGMLMVDGVLYMWVRNVANAQLAWSGDHGRTWQWGFRLKESFGSPAFLNFGKNYAGARDDYVYTYSQDGPSAYESYDAMVLARVLRARIRDRQAYEFFSRLEHGRPVWTRDLASRGPAFRYAGRCSRVDAVYHPGLKRYLLALGYNHQSGWGIFDAPEPWGPWTTAFHTESWDLPGTHGYRLPAKWIAEDGSMFLVFSGVKQNDSFCLRRMRMVGFSPPGLTGYR